MKTLKHTVAVVAVAALAVPAGVAAQGHSGTHGKSGEAHGKNHTHVNARCKHQPKVGFALGGTLDSTSTPDAVVVDVTHANKHSRPFVTDGKFAVPSGTTITYVGSNPFTTQGADVSTYKVQVVGKVVKLKKGCTADNSPAPTIRKVVVTAPDASSDTQETQQTQS